MDAPPGPDDTTPGPVEMVMQANSPGPFVMVPVDRSLPFALTGPPVSGDFIPVRRNINDLQREGGPQWDLYIQALLAMRQDDPKDTLSWFQVAGIHGLPAIVWNNTGPGIGGRDWPGYCPHGMLLVNAAQKIAQTYDDSIRDSYIEAAQQLRAPYWDWAADYRVPPSTYQARVNVFTPQGRQWLQNPLVSYSYPPEALRGDFTYFRPGSQQIVRCPPRDYPAKANQLLQRANLRERIYQAFIYSDSFDMFSSTRGNGQSLEQCHNTVHGNSGCGQTMDNLLYSAYDPLFMLHHAQVDRLWAFWQAARPESQTFNNTYAGGARFSSPAGAPIGPDSPLAPFFHEGGRPCTSNSVVDWTQFGYTYPGLDTGRRRAAPDEKSRTAKRIINQLYSNRENSPKHSWIHKAYSVSVSFRAEELRNALVDIYMCGHYVGDIRVMAAPSTGPVTGTLSVEDLIYHCGSDGPNLSDMIDKFALRIKKAHGVEVPVSSVPSLRMQVGDLVEIPAASLDEFPTIRNRRWAPVLVRQHYDTKRAQYSSRGNSFDGGQGPSPDDDTPGDYSPDGKGWNGPAPPGFSPGSGPPRYITAPDFSPAGNFPGPFSAPGPVQRPPQVFIPPGPSPGFSPAPAERPDSTYGQQAGRL
ncbi:tyrosinase 2 [Ophiocordyceps camponoti-floridani]|uniref:tyrosinase n=1 Tax=Ophiocordyceps camponoti-floridani TaxID=2030778 RepID=A0A8H4QB03_9HYPO|nr:tyrosinase 2 [Ophiocordyceps camponoti-floridani]